MWNEEKIIKIIPSVLVLFCLLEIFELVLIIDDMNKTENLEYQLGRNLEELEKIVNLLNEHLNGIGLECYKKER